MIPPPPPPPDAPDAAPPGRPLRIALAHDWLVGLRGGEFVLDRIARLIAAHHEPAGLYVMFDDARPLTPAIDALTRTASPLHRWPPAARRWLLPRYPAAVEWLGGALARDHAREPIDLLISTSSAAIKGLRPPEGVPHLCYCHSPARYLWAQGGEYARGSLPRRAGLALFGPSLRRWDERTAAGVTKFLANSRHIARRIEAVYSRDAQVVHPPVRTEFFTPDPAEARQGFWLVAGALEPYKRADLAIDAAVACGQRLVIAGDGSEAPRLRAHARRAARLAGRASPVEFVGRVTDEQLRTLYRRARCLVFPQVEDFGITAVEAQACGCPVVAFRDGGALDTVLEAETGAFFDEPTPEAIIEAARGCPEDSGACRANAVRFAEPVFDTTMCGVIGRMLG